MTTDDPIACSLTAAELRERLAEMAAIGQDSLVSVSPGGVLRFRADQQTRARLEAVIEAESKCCAFLHLELSDDGDEMTLAVSAPKGAEPLAVDLVNAFAAERKDG